MSKPVRLRTKLLAGAAGCLAAAVWTSADAQTTPSADAGAQLGEIVVVARKQAENLVDAPVAITALTAVDLERRGVVDMKALSDFTPGMKFESQSVNRNDRGFHTFVLRGMFPGSDSVERQTAGVFLDGAPVLGGAIASLDNIDRVEVVAGPQSAYFGRATFAGALNFITKPPSYDPHAKIEASYGSYKTREVKGSIEGGDPDHVAAIQLSGRYFETDGQYTNFGYPGRLGAQRTYSGSVAVLFTPTDKLRVRAYGSTWRDHDGSPASGQFDARDYNCRTRGATTPGNNYICGEIDNLPANRITQQNQVPRTVIDWLVGLKGTAPNNLPAGFIDHFGLERVATQANVSVNYELPAGFSLDGIIGATKDSWAFITDTSFRDTRTTYFTPNPNYPAVLDVLPYFSRTAFGPKVDKGTSAELRLTAPTYGRLKLMAGVNYFGFSSYLITNAFGNTGFSNPSLPTINQGQTYAVFGSARFDFGRGFTLNLEGRQQSDRISQQVITATGTHLHSVSKSFTPRVILDYKPTENATVYASYAQGVRPGAFNGGLFSRSAAEQAEVARQLKTQIAIPEEHLDMYEVGLKGEFFERRLRFLSAIYYGDWEDKHILQFAVLQGPPIQTFQVTVPGGKVHLSGVELQSTFRATRDLTFDATFNYAETKIKYSFCAECIGLLGVPYVTNNRMPRYPAITGSFSTTYSKEVAPGYDGFIRADFIYTGKQYDGETNLAWTAPAKRVNLRVGVQHGAYKFEVYGTNIFNDKAPLSLSRNTDTYTTANTISFSPADRAAVGVRVAGNF